MKKLLIVLFTAILAAGFIACSSPSSSGDSPSGNGGGASTPPAPTYSVTIEPSTNGTVTASKTSGIAAGETITLTVTPADPDDGDCALGSLSVKKGDTDLALSGSASTKSFTMPEANVTVSATFTKTTYIGSKKPSREKAVGDVVFNDGSAMPYTAFTALTDAEKNAKKTSAIALIFYKGTGLNSDTFTVDDSGNMTVTASDTTTSRTLGVGLKHNRDGLEWCTSSANAYSKNITTIQCTPSGSAGALTFTGDKNGSDNLEQIGAFDGVDDTSTAANYPAFDFAKNYSTYATNLGENYASGWYLPSIAELFQIYACRADATNGFDIDAVSQALGGDKFEDSWYWSSSQYASVGSRAYILSFYDGNWNYSLKYGNYRYVCAIRAFN